MALRTITQLSTCVGQNIFFNMLLQCRWAAVGDDEWPQQQAQRDVMLADFDFHNGYGDRSVRCNLLMLAP